MTISFRKAERQKTRLRLGIAGPAGSGKTYSALQFAFGLGGPVALIDTENGSGDLYAHLGEYDVLTLRAPFTPDIFIDGIKAAENAKYATVIIDSLSHAWAGEGGLLDQHGKIADSGKGNSYTAWRSITPKHNALVEAMLQSSCHVIATMRTKTEYIVEKNDKGKDVPRKVGLAPIQRDGMEYEFTVFLDLSPEHIATASKDRTSLFDGQYFRPTRETGEKLLAWLNAGAPLIPGPDSAVALPPAAPPDSNPPARLETQDPSAQEAVADQPTPKDLKMMTEGQNRALFRLLAARRVADTDRHRWAGMVLGRAVESFKSLTLVEASKLIETLIKEGKAVSTRTVTL